MDRPWRDMGLKDSEYERIVEIMGRDPNWTELGMFSVLWSEHCAYKHSRPLLKTLPTQGPHIVQGPGENAGVADIGDGLVVCWKAESHNHPSAIEPYQGAATGIGGIVRDILAMGARPVALLDSLRFGEPEGDARVQYLVSGVVAGISGYGNCIGVPTVGGEVAFAPEYRDNPLVNVMCVGVARRDELISAVARGVGNPLILVGNKTGRDGIHGCTFASEELGEGSEQRRPAVQVGDPFTEKLLIEACLEALTTGYVVGLQDLGAAGLTSATAETAARGGTGVEIDVSLVPRREPGMTPYEVMISESQERMLLIVDSGRQREVMAVFEKWGLEASVIGRVTADKRFRVFDGETIAADIPVAALTDEAPVYHAQQERPAYIDRAWAEPDPPIAGDWPQAAGELLLKLLGSPGISSRSWIWEQYDYMVGVDTVEPPGSDAAVIRLKGTRRGLALSTDANGRYCYLDPERGARLAVAEAGRNVVCAGGRPIGITNCQNFGNPEKPGVFWQFARVMDGMAQACRTLDMPVTGGNVSFYNETGPNAVFPTPVIGAVGLVENFERRPRGGFRAGDAVGLIGPADVGFGGSEYLYRICGCTGGRPVDVDLELEKSSWEVVLAAVSRGELVTAHDCAEGGLAVALAECAILGETGAVIDPHIDGRPDLALFGEGPGRIVVGASMEAMQRVAEDCDARGVPFTVLGMAGGDRLVIDSNGSRYVDETVTRLASVYGPALASALGKGGRGQ